MAVNSNMHQWEAPSQTWIPFVGSPAATANLAAEWDGILNAGTMSGTPKRFEAKRGVVTVTKSNGILFGMIVKSINAAPSPAALTIEVKLDGTPVISESFSVASGMEHTVKILGSPVLFTTGQLVTVFTEYTGGGGLMDDVLFQIFPLAVGA